MGPDQLTRYNLRINLGAKLSNKLSLDSRIAYTNELTEQSSRGANGQGLIYDIYRLRTRTPFSLHWDSIMELVQEQPPMPT